MTNQKNNTIIQPLTALRRASSNQSRHLNPHDASYAFGNRQIPLLYVILFLYKHIERVGAYNNHATDFSVAPAQCLGIYVVCHIEGAVTLDAYNTSLNPVLNIHNALKINFMFTHHLRSIEQRDKHINQTRAETTFKLYLFDNLSPAFFVGCRIWWYKMVSHSHPYKLMRSNQCYTTHIYTQSTLSNAHNIHIAFMRGRWQFPTVCIHHFLSVLIIPHSPNMFFNARGFDRDRLSRVTII